LAASRVGEELVAASRHNTHKNMSIAVYTVDPDDEQISVPNM
jgi:hypothetical protein